MQECSFKPKTQDPMLAERNANMTNDPSLIYGGDGKPWGFHEHMGRQEEARKRKQELEEAMENAFVSGKNWKNRVTQPIDVALGRKRGETPSSLARHRYTIDPIHE